MQSIKEEEIIIIINPNSGKKNAAKLSQQISSIFPSISTHITKDLKDLEKTFLASFKKHKAFIVVGGDGTVNEAIKYLLGKKDKLLGVLPAGSGNGFARELGFKKSIISLIEDTKKGNFIKVDVLEINGNNCINVAGLGFDSYVAHDFHKSKKRGFWNYVLSTAKSIFSFKPFEATVSFNNKTVKGMYQMISIANTRQFGNNAIIAPMAIPNDGFYNLVLVKPFPFYNYPVFVYRMLTASLKQNKYITYLQIKGTVEIQSNFKEIHIDGEPKSHEGNLKVKLLDQKISVLKTRFCRF